MSKFVYMKLDGGKELMVTVHPQRSGAVDIKASGEAILRLTSDGFLRRLSNPRIGNLGLAMTDRGGLVDMKMATSEEQDHPNDTLGILEMLEKIRDYLNRKYSQAPAPKSAAGMKSKLSVSEESFYYTCMMMISEVIRLESERQKPEMERNRPSSSF